MKANQMVFVVFVAITIVYLKVPSLALPATGFLFLLLIVAIYRAIKAAAGLVKKAFNAIEGTEP